MKYGTPLEKTATSNEFKTFCTRRRQHRCACRMQFCSSSQAKSWMFSSKSLAACKRRALSFNLIIDRTTVMPTVNHVRKFASGFHRREELNTSPNSIVPPTISIHEQETMIQFHAHQIQFLIGPNAILYDLRTNEKVLSTAIIYFRRFYLSNSIIEISPRKIAAACAFFAAKVEEERVEVRWIACHGQGMNFSKNHANFETRE